MTVRQSSNPRNNLSDFQSGEMVGIGYAPSDEERVHELLKQGNDAVCSLPDKKALASTCLALKNDIIKDIKSVYPSSSSDLPSQKVFFFTLWKNTTVIKNSSNKQHAPFLAKLMDIISIIDGYLREQESNSNALLTRHGAQERDQPGQEAGHIPRYSRFEA